jgi:hypothetical protein
MENNDLYNFLELISKAEAIVLIRDDICELVSFNEYRSIDKYKLSIEEKSQHAFFSYLDSVINGSVYTIMYHNCLINHIEDILSCFELVVDILTYKKLVVRDMEERIIDYEILPLPVKQKIASFLSVLYDVLFNFYQQLDQPNDFQVSLPISISPDHTTDYQPDINRTVNEPRPQYPDEKLAEGDKWLDNEDVCRLLKCSTRTLQRYRDQGTIRFTQIGGKMYYNESDVLGMMKKNYR